MTSYTITKSDGTTLGVVAYQTINDSLSPLRLLGRRSSQYGQFVAQNFVWLAENFANTTEPANKLRGMLWFDTSDSTLKLWDGSTWKTTLTGGTSGSNATLDTLTVTGGTVLNGDTNIIKSQPRLNLYKTSGGGQNNTIQGWLRTTSGQTTTDTLRWAMVLGDSTAETGGNAGSDFQIARYNDGGTFLSNVISITRSTGLITTSNGLTVTGALAASGGATATTLAVSGSFSAAGVINANGSLAVTGGITRSGGTASDIGASGTRFGTVWATTFDGVATSARYADLAERYAADSPMESGDVVMLGGEAEITKTVEDNTPDVFGVVSTNPAFRMNEAAGDDTTHPFVALAGRVPCKVVGKVKKGQRLVASDVPGVARAYVLEQSAVATAPAAVFARALADKNDDGIGLVEVVVGAR